MLTKPTRAPLALLSFLVLFVASGAACPKRFPDSYATPSPVILTENPTFEDVARVVNANSARIQQIQVNNATLSFPGAPSLQASYAVDRPRRFRLTADLSLMGREVDLGSNDEHYWIWLKRDPSRAVYYGRHEEFYRSAARSIIPVPPQWLVEALGVVELDPTGQHEGPTENRPGQLEIRSRIPTPTGELTKITVIDAQRGWVLEQQLYDTNAGNQLLASTSASEFNYYPGVGVSLPRVVEVRLPPADLEFTLQTDQHLINQLYADPEALWSIPQPPGNELVDLNTMSSPPPKYVEPTYEPTADRRGTMRNRYRPRRELTRLPDQTRIYR